MKKITISIVSLFAVFVVALGLLIAQNVSLLKAFYTSLAAVTAQKPESESILFDLNNLREFTKVAKKITHTKIILFFSSPQQKLLFTQLATTLPDFETILDQLLIGEQRWLLIFQNSNELRATGGFMGSYAIVDITEGKITEINIEDIYDADGQFTGYVAAPQGVAEYLSSGRGLRLPDANWHPDTGKSAEQILPFFALGNKQNVSGIVFVSLDFAKSILEFLGPIELADYNTIITPDNIDEVLRTRRDEFFPGSMQKKHMLSQLITQVRLKIFSLQTQELISLISLLESEIQKHTLQFYSNNAIIDQLFLKHSLRQVISIPENSDYVYLVESNVGINKANRNINRAVEIAKTTNTRSIKITFSNNNAVPTVSRLTHLTDLESSFTATQEGALMEHLAYINYQRILVPSEWELSAVRFQGKAVTTLDTKIIQSNGFEFKEIGFLITLPEETTGILELTFTTQKDFDTIYVQKQPGTPTINYVLEYNQKQLEHNLTQNTLLTYP